MAFQELRRHSNTFRPPLQIPFNRPKQGRESWLYVKGYKICRKGFAKNMEPCKPAGLISKKYGAMQVCMKGFAKNMGPCKPAGLISKKYGTMQACIRGSWKNMELCKPAWPNLEKNWHNPIVLTQIRDDNITWERSLPHGWEHFLSMKTTVATWQEICSITAHYWEILPHHRTSKIVVPMILWTIRY